MKFEFNEQEIARAIQFYVEQKSLGKVPTTVTIHWRGKTAVVETLPIPTLTDVAERAA